MSWSRGLESAAKQFGLRAPSSNLRTDIDAQIRAVADSGPSLMFASLTTQGELQRSPRLSRTSTS